MRLKLLVYSGFVLIFYAAIFTSLAFSQAGEWKTYKTSNGDLSHDDVRAIAVAGDDIWFGTYGGGLCRYRKSIAQQAAIEY